MDTTDAGHEPIATVLSGLSRHFGDRLRLFADTEELAAAYRDLVGQTVTTVPLPVITPPIRSAPVGSPPHLVYAGGARAEKGYHHLPELIRRLGDRARFSVHSGRITDNADPLVQRAHRVLQGFRAQGVTLIEESLSPEAYLALIGAADLLLLPYDGPAYGPRSSGILAEARAMGVPAIVPAGCWMAREAGPARSLIFERPEDIPTVVEAALTDLDTLSALYRDSAAAWRVRHNPDRLFSALSSWPDRDRP